MQHNTKQEKKKAISEWKQSILKKYPLEAHLEMSAKEIIKKNYQVNYKFN